MFWRKMSGGLHVNVQVDTAALLLAVLYIAMQFAAPQLFVGTAAGPLLLPAAATAAAALLRIFDPARYVVSHRHVNVG
jgi:hypothetical protein